MKFADVLRDLRHKSGLTQEQLADRSGVALNTIRTHEQGYGIPGLRAAYRLAVALGVPLNELANCDEVTGEGVKPRAVGKRK